MNNSRLQGWNAQKTAFTYAKDRTFEPGLRSGALYADLGLAEATGGQFHGEITKINPEFHAEKITAQNTTGTQPHDTTGMHRHGYDFQFNYVISGEVDFVIEGFDETMTFRAGDTYFLPPKILHNETRMTEDFQVLQLYAPANDPTEQLTPEVL